MYLRSLVNFLCRSQRPSLAPETSHGIASQGGIASLGSKNARIVENSKTLKKEGS